MSKLGLWVCIFLCARVSKTCHVLLDFDLCFSEVLTCNMDGHRDYLSRKEVEDSDSDSAIFVILIHKFSLR